MNQSTAQKIPTRTRRRKLPNRRGAVAVEFALTAPLLFMFLFAALELGHANMVFNVAEAAAYEGARQGIVPGATVADCEAAVDRLLGIAKIQGGTVTVTPSSLTTESDTIQVTIQVPYSQNTIITPTFTQGLNIQRTCVLSRENI